jgi:hypothetical protein
VKKYHEKNNVSLSTARSLSENAPKLSFRAEREILWRGAVTLTGVVFEESRRGLAKETVAGLPGVKSVDYLNIYSIGQALLSANGSAADIQQTVALPTRISRPH